MQDFTGVPAVVDLAAMRDAMAEMGGDPARINPLAPAELVIDHSVQVDAFGTRDAFRFNAEREFERNQERYAFLRWGQGAFDDFSVVPPDTGIVHQVNLEYLARVVFPREPAQPAAGLPGHARRHRLAHDDGQRPRRARLGRRRHRGRGGDARPADVDADPAGARRPAARRAARGHDRDRPRADRHRDASRARRRRHVRRVLRRRRRRAADRRPRDDRQHVARVRLDLRDLPDRRRDAPLPRAHRPPPGADRAGRGLRPRAGPVARRGLRGADVHRHARARPRDRRAEPRRAQAPAGPRRAERGPAGLPSARSRTTCPTTASRPTSRTRRSPSPTRRPTRPPTALPATRPLAATAPQLPPAGAVGTLPHNGTAQAVRARRRELRGRPRPRRDRGDHELHEHVEPVGDGRRRDPRAQRRRARAALQAVGQDLARARLEGRHRIPRPRRADRAARSARLQPRRLRLHDLHRQLRPAARGDLRGRRRAATSPSSRCSRATATSRGASTPT